MTRPREGRKENHVEAQVVIGPVGMADQPELRRPHDALAVDRVERLGLLMREAARFDLDEDRELAALTTRSSSPTGVFTRRSSTRKPCSCRNSAAQASPRRPAPSANLRKTLGLFFGFEGEGGIVDVLALETEPRSNLVDRGAQRLIDHRLGERGAPLVRVDDHIA